MQAFRTILGVSNMLAYLSMMAPRLLELWRVLKPTGSLYLHCDPTASHYLKIMLDSVFDPENFRNEIIWRRTGSNNSAKRFGPVHQTILFYGKSKKANFYNPKGPYTKHYVEESFDQEDARGRYQRVALTGPGTRKGESGMPWRGYNPTDVGRHWQPAAYLYSKYSELTGQDLAQWPLLERLDKLDEVGLIHWPKKADSVPRYKFYIHDAPGVPLQDMWGFQPGTEGCVYGRPEEGIDQDVKWLSVKDSERLGYPTQKPEGLLRRIIKASTQKGDVVLDPFCGCGTSIAVAHSLDRRWIGIDVTYLATHLIKSRLRDAFAGTAEFKVVGEPTTIEEAVELGRTDPYQFQFWALGLVGARSTEEKKGADKGLDGRLYFHETPTGPTKQIIFSVKAGKVQPQHVRDLRGVIDREKAQIGVLISLQPPTKPMKSEAASSGFYESGWGNYPRLQLITVEELLNGKRIEMPAAAHTNATFR